MHICPYCASEYIFYSKKHNVYICEDCDNEFEKPSENRGMRIFISYGHDKNAHLVELIKEFLVRQGYDVWIDSSDITRGSDWRERITNGLVGSNGVLAFLSKYSIRDPGVCRDEIRIALRLKHSFVKSILLENAEIVKPPYRLTDSQWIDMSNWDSIEHPDWDAYFARKMKELIEALESDDARQYSQEIGFIGKKLGVSEGIAKENILLREEFIGRMWLAEKVQDWLVNGSDQRMVLLGVPGSGKSAFAANLASYDENIAAAIFLQWNNALYRDGDTVIKRLAYKLACELNDYRRMVCELLNENEGNSSLLEKLHGTALFDWLIIEPLLLCVDGERGRRLVVIDGLDETSDNVANMLYTKAAEFPKWIRFLFTTRYDETALTKFNNATTEIIDEHSSANAEDILQYIQYRLDRSIDDETVNRMVEQSQGSFIYAKTLCEAISNGVIDVDELSELPAGIKEFYYTCFTRMFSSDEQYVEVRPFLELMCVDENLSDVLICAVLGLDKYGLWKLRSYMNNLIVSTNNKFPYGDRKIFQFVHKTIGDWIQDQNEAGRFYVDKLNGYRLLADTCKSIDEGPDSDNAGKDIRFFRLLEPTWLFKSHRYEEYKNLLLNSFDVSEAISPGNYTYYYKFVGLWDWAEQLPEELFTRDISDKLREIVAYPKKWMCSEFAHRSFQITALMFRELLVNGRLKDVFYDFILQLSYANYFKSSASDLDGETRDGWDKYYMTRDVNYCIKKLDLLNIEVPDNVRMRCEAMKLTFCYYRGDPKEGMLQYSDILKEEGFYKDICILDTNDSFECKLKKSYNTLSLQYYLEKSNDYDWDFINGCIENLADLTEACSAAEKRIQDKYDSSEQIDYIKKIKSKYI